MFNLLLNFREIKALTAGVYVGDTISCVAFSKSLNVSEPQFPHLQNEYDKCHLSPRLIVRLTERTQAICLTQCPGHGQN